MTRQPPLIIVIRKALKLLRAPKALAKLALVDIDRAGTPRPKKWAQAAAKLQESNRRGPKMIEVKNLIFMRPRYFTGIWPLFDVFRSL